ncbi:ribosomal protein S6 kinase alpha-5-like [Arctopsyche grandis]|uniref:ribosomal protein S6 kinase alpha-5-like n=1 Tax=Arctopsyche grandis TaxID=121162 RepID=UPI00406D9689
MKEVMGARRQHEHESGYYEGSDRESVHNMMRQSSSSERIHSSTRSRQNGGCNKYQEDAAVKTQRHQRQSPLHHHSPPSSANIDTDSHCRRRNGLVQQTNAISVDNDSASVMDVDTVISVESGDTERGEETPNPQSGCSDTNQAPGEVLRNRSSSVQVVAAYDAPMSPVLGWDLIRTSRIKKKGVVLNSTASVGPSDFSMLKVLGTGAYGKVFLVRKTTGIDVGCLYAMKILKKSTIISKKKTAEHTRTERQVLEAIRKCPFLVTMHYAFQTDARLHLVLDYVSGGELFTHLFQRERFTEAEVTIYIAEIILALEQLHKRGIIYRDIKLENILLDSEGHVILTDFGLSKEFLPNEKRAYSFCGTIEYMAPEVVRTGNHGHDHAVDWWSVGVLAYELLTGGSPFTENQEGNTQSEISRRILRKQPNLAEHLSKNMSDFIRRLLIKDPRLRLGGGEADADDLKRHPLFRGLDWDALARKAVGAPFKPTIIGELDTRNFSEEFTTQPPLDTPATAPPDHEKLFHGYSYIAPSILFSENILNPDMLDGEFLQNSSVKPDAINLFACKLKNSLFFVKYDLNLRDRILGDGSFSVCRKCVHKVTRKQYAVKIISRKIDCSQEVSLLKKSQNHPNIVTLHEVYEDELYTYIVMELLSGGELLSRIPFDESDSVKITIQILSAILHLHSLGVVHRDIKPENLIFTNNLDDVIKIVDFGFARSYQTKIENTNGFSDVHHSRSLSGMHTPCFSLPYAAPEVLEKATGGVNGYTESCDYWSLGVIVYSMLAGHIPFQRMSKDEPIINFMDRIKQGHLSWDGGVWSHISSSAKNLIEGLLSVDPSKRLTREGVLKHPWINKSRNSPTDNKGNINRIYSKQKTESMCQDTFAGKISQRKKLQQPPSDTFGHDNNFNGNKNHREGPSIKMLNKSQITTSNELNSEFIDSNDLEVMSYTMNASSLINRENPTIISSMSYIKTAEPKTFVSDINKNHQTEKTHERSHLNENQNCHQVKIENDDYFNENNVPKEFITKKRQMETKVNKNSAHVFNNDEVQFSGDVRKTYTRRKPQLDSFMFLDTTLNNSQNKNSSLNVPVDTNETIINKIKLEETVVRRSSRNFNKAPIYVESLLAFPKRKRKIREEVESPIDIKFEVEKDSAVKRGRKRKKSAPILNIKKKNDSKVNSKTTKGKFNSNNNRYNRNRKGNSNTVITSEMLSNDQYSVPENKLLAHAIKSECCDLSKLKVEAADMKRSPRAASARAALLISNIYTQEASETIRRMAMKTSPNNSTKKTCTSIGKSTRTKGKRRRLR